MSEGNISTGISLPTLLQVLFIGAKLSRLIDWRWIWVLTPTWGSFLIFVFVFLSIYKEKIIGNKKR